nr:hypothetical protein [Tanacetum cinerariifolium]
MVLTSMDAPTVLAGGIDVPTGGGFIPTAGPPATEVMVESDTPKKKKLQEQINAQVARELEEQQEKEDMRMNKQIAKDAEVARIHAEEELQGLSFKEIKAKFAEVWKQVEDFIPMGSKEEAERLKKERFKFRARTCKEAKVIRGSS